MVLEGFLTDVGDVAGDLFLPQLGVARDALELLDVDRGEHVVAEDALGDEDGVLEVVPLQGMKATITFWPSASSPVSVAGPSAITSPFFTRSPAFTIGFWLMQVFWSSAGTWSGCDVDLAGHVQRGVLGVGADHDAARVHLIDQSRRPGGSRADAESRATRASMPVPHQRRRGAEKGHRLRCMLEPISARLASSFSGTGISDAATRTSWFGDTSIR